jgi:hypothetical protein
VTENLLALLQEQLEVLGSAADILDYSYEQCLKIGIKASYTYEELDRIESFTSRFARLSDILTQKLFRLIARIELEDSGTVRDRINQAEKRGLIDDADIFAQIRILRNDIAHEYMPEATKEIYRKALTLTPHLLDGVKRTRRYAEKLLVELRGPGQRSEIKKGLN